jgi:hypothetical protein
MTLPYTVNIPFKLYTWAENPTPCSPLSVHDRRNCQVNNPTCNEDELDLSEVLQNPLLGS